MINENEAPEGYRAVAAICGGEESMCALCDYEKECALTEGACAPFEREDEESVIFKSIKPEKPKDRTGIVQINREGIITTVQFDDETVCGIKIVHDLKEAKKESIKIEFGKY